MNDSQPQIIAVWAPEEDLKDFSVFTPDTYADWADMNNLSGTYTYPVRFYGLGDTATLVELTHTVVTGPYDDNDYAMVTHTWYRPGDPTPYAIGTVRTDGRA